MTIPTIRNLINALMRRLCLRASSASESRNLGRSIHARFAALGGVELELPARRTGRGL
ncbi:hypothetical protein GCM10017083_07750 [Thalassobaculum fulvum]|uniref:Uncharacterized protein n=1 Tax=Thalassobaculum fulvum TaxID=1633335 RepID=A0A918XNN1_9PROT|nr:hypothetical protein [Thalassobaculum fulvum]GHD42575.1 hypothetical protein GCM10017083_07750 [Thalassobaculum fulvum]